MKHNQEMYCEACVLHIGHRGTTPTVCYQAQHELSPYAKMLFARDLLPTPGVVVHKATTSPGTTRMVVDWPRRSITLAIWKKAENI